MLDQIPAARAPAVLAEALPARDRALMEAAQRLEGAFLAEMLRSAGVGEPRGFGGGGYGESQFSSFLREAYAEEIAKTGGIGLAERLFEALKRDG